MRLSEQTSSNESSLPLKSSASYLSSWKTFERANAAEVCDAISTIIAEQLLRLDARSRKILSQILIFVTVFSEKVHPVRATVPRSLVSS